MSVMCPTELSKNQSLSDGVGKVKVFNHLSRGLSSEETMMEVPT